jgi:hypothetical protein
VLVRVVTRSGPGCSVRLLLSCSVSIRRYTKHSLSPDTTEMVESRSLSAEDGIRRVGGTVS